MHRVAMCQAPMRYLVVQCAMASVRFVNESFGTRIDSTQPIVVERSLYSNANGIIWAAGTNATATRLPEP